MPRTTVETAGGYYHRPPGARRDACSEVLHGVRVVDPYQWLEQSCTQESQEWSAAQDAHWLTIRDDLPGLMWWRRQIARFIDVDFESAPIWRGDTRFVMRHKRGRSAPGLYATGADGVTRELLETALPGRLKDGVKVQSWQPSPDGRWLALTVCQRGSEDGSLLVVDVASGRVIDGPIDGCGHTSVAWQQTGFFYGRRSSPTSDRRVFLHTIGRSSNEDREVFARCGASPCYYSLSTSKDGGWLAVSVSVGSPADGNELWLATVESGVPVRFELIQSRGCGNSGITFAPDGMMYVLTNREAPNWRIMVADPRRPAYHRWRELIGQDPVAVINDFAVLAGTERSARLLVSWSRDAVSEVSLHDLHGGSRLETLPLPVAGRVGPLVTRDGTHAWFSYTDCTTAPVVLEYIAATGATAISTAPRRAAGPETRTEHLWCTSADGTPIQMIAVRPANSAGPLPLILSGYGGFGTSLQPQYSASSMAWVTSGGVYVIANIRGGGERGERWHAAGRRHAKQNAIDDFLACARHLIVTGWTTPGKLAIWGGSNGALLVAAALTQRPELFAVAVCSAPLCDMVRYERSGMGVLWRSEYGSVADATDFRHLLAYSPYHRVADGVAYPATLFAVSDDDERVDPAHARKMCASLQSATTGDGPIVLRRELHVGHTGHGITGAVDYGGDVLAFIAAHTGLRS